MSILKQQAALLGREDSPTGEGRSPHSDHRHLFVDYFYIAAPTLSYKFELFTLSHGVNFYPLVMKYLNNTISINSESQFKDKLREIFAAPHILNVVHSILAQVRS